MKGWLAYLAFTAAGLLLTAVALFAGLIFFDAPATPGPVAGEASPDAPALRTLHARDGAPLAYRLYPGPTEAAAVLVHGSSSSSRDMHGVAQALQAVGATVYSIDLRGHGGSGFVKGDAAYVGQLDDDLVDIVKRLALDKPGIRRTLAGFSAGGGFALRVASGRRHALFDDYLAISPFIVVDPDLLRSTTGYANIAARRIAALASLEQLGLPLFQGLTVVRYAAPADADHTPAYTYRLTASLRLDANWRAALHRISAPTVFVIGAGDASLRAVASLNPRIEVRDLPTVDHLQMIASETATSAIAAAWRRSP